MEPVEGSYISCPVPSHTSHWFPPPPPGQAEYHSGCQSLEGLPLPDPPSPASASRCIAPSRNWWSFSSHRLPLKEEQGGEGLFTACFFCPKKKDGKGILHSKKISGMPGKICLGKMQISWQLMGRHPHIRVMTSSTESRVTGAWTCSEQPTFLHWKLRLAMLLTGKN